jgi:hypothetical protein
MTAPTPPADDQPTALDVVRLGLAAAMVKTMAVLGWPEERVHAYPPRQPTAPTVWVDVGTLAQSNVGGAPGLTLTIPVCVAVDGITDEQVRQLDKLMAYGVTHLEAADVGDQRGHPKVLTVGPDSIDLGTGYPTRALVFQVQHTLLLRTLCTGTITPRNP